MLGTPEADFVKIELINGYDFISKGNDAETCFSTKVFDGAVSYAPKVAEVTIPHGASIRGELASINTSLDCTTVSATLM